MTDAQRAKYAEEERKWKEAEAAVLAQQANAAKPWRKRIAAVGGALVAPILAFVFLVLPALGTSITVSAPDGAADSLQVTGKGFQGDETVNLDIGSVVVGTTIAASDGSIDTSLEIPPGATSPIVVRAEGQTSKRWAVGTFERAAVASSSPEPTGTDAGPTPTGSEPEVDRRGRHRRAAPGFEDRVLQRLRPDVD